MNASKNPVPPVEARERSRFLISPWAILGAFLIGLCLLGLVFASVWASRPGPEQVVPSTPELVVVRAPTATSPVPTAVPTEANPDSQVPTPSGSGDIEVGTLVQVTGTGGDGLRVR